MESLCHPGRRPRRQRTSSPTGFRCPLWERRPPSCRGCHLWELGTQTVFGEGSSKAEAMFVGEQPGDQEDRAGRPFVGPAVRLFDEALEAAPRPSEAELDRVDGVPSRPSSMICDSSAAC